MKKILTALLLAASLFTGSLLPGAPAFAASSQAETSASQPETEAPAVNLPEDKVSTQDIAIYSKAACVMDAKTGQVLYYKNPSDRHYPASITKVLTALLLIENKSLTDELAFTQECWEGINRWEDMNVAMEPDESLTAEQALYCMLLVSANEVCNQVAVNISGSVAAFADLMNSRAQELGATGTHFVTTNGLHDENHYTTAYDMALISRAAILNDTFRQVTGSTYYKVTTGRRPEGFELYNKHRMLAAPGVHDERCIGGKTGYTPQANNTLVTYMEEGDVTLACVVMDNNNGHIYSDTKLVCDYCFDHYSRSSIDELAATDQGKAMNEAGITGKKAEQDSPAGESAASDPSAESQRAAGESLHLMDGTLTEELSQGLSPARLAGRLQDLAIQAFLRYIPYSFLVLIAAFLIFTLILIWLRGVIHRKIHRRRYKKLRNGGKKKSRKR